MKQTDKELQKIFGKKASPIDKKSLLNGLDSEFRDEMIRFIRGFGLTESKGEYHRYYDHVDFAMYSDDQISMLYMQIRKAVVDAIMNKRIKREPSAYYIAVVDANKTVKDNAISILLESR